MTHQEKTKTSILLSKPEDKQNLFKNLKQVSQSKPIFMKDYKKESKSSTNQDSQSNQGIHADDGKDSKLVTLTPKIKVVTTSFEDFESLEKNIKKSSKGNTLDSLISSHQKSQNENSAQSTRKNSNVNDVKNGETDKEQHKHDHKVSELDLQNQEFMSKSIYYSE